jgi:hypothetical protein
VERRPAARRDSTRAMTSASKPSPAGGPLVVRGGVDGGDCRGGSRLGAAHRRRAGAHGARRAEGHQPGPSHAQRGQDLRRRLHRVAGPPERAGEDVGGAPRDDGEHRQLRCGAVRQEAVDHLVDGAVAADGDHEVHTVGGGLLAEFAGVPAVARLDDVELELAGEGADQEVAHLGARAGRRRVDHHERAHGRQANRAANRSTVGRDREEPQDSGRVRVISPPWPREVTRGCSSPVTGRRASARGAP